MPDHWRTWIIPFAQTISPTISEPLASLPKFSTKMSSGLAIVFSTRHAEVLSAAESMRRGHVYDLHIVTASFFNDGGSKGRSSANKVTG
jgi:hypothetical protein